MGAITKVNRKAITGMMNPLLMDTMKGMDTMLAVNKKYQVVLFGADGKAQYNGLSEGMPQPYGSGFRFMDSKKGGIEIILSGNVVIQEFIGS